jgi:ferric-chelate reductase
LKWDRTSNMLGHALPFTIGVLFTPVARGSPILRLIDVPFEQAVKYHRWLGYLTVLLVFVHGATYGVYAGAIHQIELVSVLVVPLTNPVLGFQIAEESSLHVKTCVTV